METIKDRLRKIKALADRGIDGEAIAAQAQLEKLLSKYNLRIQDIFNESLKIRQFKVSRNERHLFAQVLGANIGDRYKQAYCLRFKPSVMHIELTDAEYVDFEQQFSFFTKQFKKELKKAQDQLLYAFCYKHDLFNKDKEAVPEDKSPINLDEYLEIIAAAKRLENVTFRKQLTA